MSFFFSCFQDGDVIKKPPSVGLASKKCQQVLVELEGVLQHLEAMFSLTLVPRVLILLGGNAVSPKELYELNLEGICVGSAEKSLKTTSCVRKLFHSLFIADVFSELKALPITGTVVMLQGHRNCGAEWFRPKLNYKVPTRGRKLTINLSCDGDVDISASAQTVTSAWEDYIWFQAPVTLKGFHEWSVLCRSVMRYWIIFGAALGNNSIKGNGILLSLWISSLGHLLPSWTAFFCVHLLTCLWKQMPFKAQLHTDTMIP